MTTPAPERRSIVTREEAERFLAAFADTMSELQEVLDHETAELSAGRVRSALAREERKGALASGYLKGLEHARANAVALARFAPEAAHRLKDAHAGFRTALARNQAVLETGRAVSDGIFRGVAVVWVKLCRPAAFGGTPSPRSSAAPLVYSGRF